MIRIKPMSDVKSKFEQFFFRAIPESHRALKELVFRISTDRDMPDEYKTTQAAIMNAIALYLGTLPYSEQRKMVLAGMEILNDLSSQREGDSLDIEDGDAAKDSPQQDPKSKFKVGNDPSSPITKRKPGGKPKRRA